MLVFPSSGFAAKRRRWKPQGKQIRQIHITHKNIFDPAVKGENKLAYRLVNKLHIPTKDWVIRQELLLKEGEAYDEDLAKESARALRRILRLRKVKINTKAVANNMVDLQVEVHETWTTEPTISLSGVGDELSGKIGIREYNFLGFGKQVSYFYKKDKGAIGRSFSYDDPNLFTTRMRLSLDYSDSEDGLGRAFSLGRPFYSSVTPWSFAWAGKAEDLRTRFFQNGQEVAKFKHHLREISYAYAHSIGSTPRHVQRLGAGYRYLEDSVSSLTPVNAMISDHRYHILQSEVYWERVNFLTLDHIKQYEREEDFNLGPFFRASPGFSRKWFKNSTAATFLNSEAFVGMRFGPGSFALATARQNGRYEKKLWVDTRSRLDIEYYNHFSPRQTFAFHVQGEQLSHPAANSQITLGGDSGLRGYQLNQFAGHRLLLMNVEDRFFLVEDVLKIFSLGAVAFFDTGYVWTRGNKIGLNDVKADIGTGLRFYISRSSQGHVLRLDAAYALKRVKGESRLVITFGSDHAF